ncbi:MAG: hypothetical protein ABIZ80_21130 [Bryobacteraceae bacterium]
MLVRAGDSVSNESTFAYAGADGPCKDPFGFREEELRALDEDKTVRLGLVTARSDVLPAAGLPDAATYERSESLFADFARRDAESVAMLAQPLVSDARYFSCRLLNPVTIATFVFAEPFDAGDTLHLQGPEKSLEAPHPNLPTVYANLLPPKDPRDPPFFTAGTWTLTAPGGQTVKPFEVSRQLPPPLRWLNREALAEIDRGADLTVTWSADGYTVNDVMTVTLESASPLPVRAGAVSCRAPASAGRLTLPASMLASLARIPVGRLDLRLAPRPDRRVGFDLPLAGGGVERAAFDYLFTDTLRVAVR